MRSLDVWFLRLVAALLFVFGAIYTVDPARLAGDVGILFDAVGATDVRATYGGVQIGLALFLVWCSRRPRQISAGLASVAAVLGTVAVLRVLGPVLGDGWASFHTGALFFEIFSTIVAAWLLRRTPHPEAVP